MCFYHSYEWRAETYEEGVQTADPFALCDECDRVIPAGEKYHHIHMEQYEYCRECGGNPLDDDYDDNFDCTCEEPDFGEVQDYSCCLDCRRALEAVEASEVEAGCKGDSTRPALTRLKDAMTDEDGERYRLKALQLFPDLGPHLELLAGKTS